MIKKMNKCYMDELFENEKFEKDVQKELEKLLVAEEIIKARKKACLTQRELADKINTTRSAISRYESGNYTRFSLPLLNRIAKACKAKLKVAIQV